MKRILLIILLLSLSGCFNDLVNRSRPIPEPDPDPIFSNSIYYEERNVNIDETVFPTSRKPERQNIFIFSPREHRWAVYNQDGERVGFGRATGGKDFCDDVKSECRTVIGKFQVFRKEDKDCASKTFPIDEGGGAPMPYCMFFYKGYAIHGSDHVIDGNVSHGCVRVTRRAAQWIHENYIHQGSYVLVLPYE